MLKIGIIGSGDIVRKAYLPVLSNRPVEIHLFARNEEKRLALAKQFHINNVYSNLDELIKGGIDAAFVNTSTTSHEEIVSELISHNIHVSVDKPVTYNYESTLRLF